MFEMRKGEEMTKETFSGDGPYRRQRTTFVDYKIRAGGATGLQSQSPVPKAPERPLALGGTVFST